MAPAKKTPTKKTPTKKTATKKAPAKKPTPKKKYEAKTKPTQVSPASYLAAITDPQRRQDCQALVELMSAITGKPPVMWGPSIVGFDAYHYKYDSGHEGDCCLLGFASRKADLTIYLMSGFEGAGELLAKLGRHRTSKACLYVKRLSDLDLGVLETLLRRSAAEIRKRYP
ncbi:MAG: DUF1801 domain-containing protein [bacterium]|nr:DUF1801 domain-containing protein [bacterium]